jgi:hypothetical protein
MIPISAMMMADPGYLGGQLSRQTSFTVIVKNGMICHNQLA